MNSEIVDTIRRLGRQFGPAALEATREAYAPSVRRQPREGTAVRIDVAYGPDERHLLDVYGSQRQGPVVLFVHGGGFNAGDKCGTELFYSNIGHHFAASGVQAVLANYRLAPRGTWPSGVEDVQRMVQWTRDHLGAGGAGRPLVLVGQSAGACHAAGYLYGEATQRHAGESLAGCILMSGVYDLHEARSPGALAYFGDDAALRIQRSPAGQVSALRFPLMVTVSEYDPPDTAWQGFNLAGLVARAAGGSPHFHWFRDHNHVSPVLSLGSGQREVGEVLGGFVGLCAQRAAQAQR